MLCIRVLSRNFRLLVCAATSWLSNNQPKKMQAYDGQLKLTIHDGYIRIYR